MHVRNLKHDCEFIRGVVLRKSVLLLSILLLCLTAKAANVTIYFFYSTTCSHCHAESIFLTKLEPRYPSLDVKRLAVDISPSNAQLMKEFMETHNISSTAGVPQTYIGNSVIIGYVDDETTGKLIEQKAQECLQAGCNQTVVTTEEYVFDYPIIGRVDIRTVSLPFLSFLLGLLDGFNPCAMWVLIYLLTMLAATKDRRRVILIAGTFIVASAFWYFLILTGWLKLWDIIGLTDVTRVIIGAIAIFAGIMNLKDYVTLPAAVCKVTDVASHSSIMKRAEQIAKPSAVPATLLGIIILAFTVNTIEFACSAGFPTTFTRILALNKLPAIEYYLYIFIYLFFYMLDDIIVFAMAVLTLSLTDFSSKYGKFSQLVGGIVLLLLGMLLVFMPSALS
jgi:cytochrome c biogenesis protein CcdA/glutaredoxin